jgi:hypothetical protein
MYSDAKIFVEAMRMTMKNQKSEGESMTRATEEILDVMDAEIRRFKGSRYRSEKKLRLKKLARKALLEGNRGLFEQVLIALGQQRGSSVYQKSMSEFDACQSAKRWP